jgi:hypothetical protein
MSEHEHDESVEEDREDTIQDLDVPEEQGDDVTGGKKNEEGWKI